MMAMFLLIVVLYVAVGLVCGLAFVFVGVNRVDPIAHDSPMVFRVIILPGCVGLWPVVLWKWKNASKGKAT